jgi:hypothetical protein
MAETASVVLDAVERSMTEYRVREFGPAIGTLTLEAAIQPRVEEQQLRDDTPEVLDIADVLERLLR